MSQIDTGRNALPVLPRRQMLRDTVYDVLHDMLVSGAFAAGEALSIDGLAQRLDVSPTPVREALVQLESTGMVTRTALRGYRVAPPLSWDQMGQLFDARLLLEVGAAERAVAHAEELVPRLHELQRHHAEAGERLKAAMGEGAVPPAEARDYFTADWAFHEAVLQATGNRFLVEMAGRLGTHAQRLRQFIEYRQLDVDHALEEHRQILAAFERSDVQQVVAAVRYHVEAVRSRAMGQVVHE